MASITISESEILDELRASLGSNERPAGYLTIQEMAEQAGCSRKTAQNKVEALEAQGRVESMTVLSQRRDGVGMRVTVYRMKKAKR